MRYTGAALAAVLAFGLVGSADDAKDGRYVSKEGGFSVQYPAGADVKTKSQDAPGGLKMIVTGVEGERKAFMVMYMALPDGFVKATTPKKILDGAADGAVKKGGGKQVSTKDITFGNEKYPGREVVVAKDGNLVRTQVIVADPKIYVLVVGGPGEFANTKAAADFLNSFELTPAAKAKSGD